MERNQKMKRAKRALTGVMAAMAMLAAVRILAGDLTPPSAPGPTMHTLEDIYQKLEATQRQLADVEARLNAEGSSITAGNMVLIPAGSFVMGAATNVGQEAFGDETPQHTVYVSAFYIDKYEVASNLWREVYTWATNRGYSFGNYWSVKAPNHPIHSVDWYDAIAWCNARSQREGFTPCYTNADGTVYTNAAVDSFSGGCNWAADGYRLPTEAEWEKAARGGVAYRRFPWDDVNTIQHARANYNANPSTYAYDTSPTTGTHPTYKTIGVYPFTSPVGAFAPNRYGLYDMAGNVFEWCWDWYGSSYYASSPTTNPTGPPGPLTYRVLRGGSWDFSAGFARVAYRYEFFPQSSNNFVGFRCVRR